MNKLLSSVGLAIAVATASMLAGCQLYFGSSSNGNGSGNGNGPSGGGDRPPGFGCSGDAQCAAGCFCSMGTCTEGGFCGTDKDCGSGFHCDTGRSSCIPNPTCSATVPCPMGSMCDDKAGGCVTTCKCTSDADAVRQGFAWCDESRSTCMSGTDPAGACLGVISCTTAPPACPDGQVALRKDGCFTGGCRAIAACEGAPTCDALQHEDDCLGRLTDCSTVYEGHGCHKPDGTACHAGDADCTCTSFTFQSCEVKGQAATRIIPVD
jgi:hypothetical protein